MLTRVFLWRKASAQKGVASWLWNLRLIWHTIAIDRWNSTHDEWTLGRDMKYFENLHIGGDGGGKSTSSHRVSIFKLSRTDRILWILIDAGNHEAYAPTPTFETCNLERTERLKFIKQRSGRTIDHRCTLIEFPGGYRHVSGCRLSPAHKLCREIRLHQEYGQILVLPSTGQLIVGVSDVRRDQRHGLMHAACSSFQQFTCQPASNTPRPISLIGGEHKRVLQILMRVRARLENLECHFPISDACRMCISERGMLPADLTLFYFKGGVLIINGAIVSKVCTEGRKCDRRHCRPVYLSRC